MVRLTTQRLGRRQSLLLHPSARRTPYSSRPDLAQAVLELRFLIAAIGVKLERGRLQAKNGRHQQRAVITAFAKRSRFAVLRGLIPAAL